MSQTQGITEGHIPGQEEVPSPPEGGALGRRREELNSCSITRAHVLLHVFGLRGVTSEASSGTRLAREARG
eukprot:1331366-Amorphochlora_amoeboformis.AAC.1